MTDSLSGFLRWYQDFCSRSLSEASSDMGPYRQYEPHRMTCSERWIESRTDWIERVGEPMTLGHTEGSDTCTADRGSSVNNIRIGFEGTTLGIVLSLVLVIAACGVVMGMNISEQRELERHYDALDRQSRMTELKLDDWTVVAHRAGLQLPGDYTRGPQGNPDADSFHIKPKGK